MEGLTIQYSLKEATTASPLLSLYMHCAIIAYITCILVDNPMPYDILTRGSLGALRSRLSRHANSGFSWFSCRVRMKKESTLT